MPKADLLPIDTNRSMHRQPCLTFGVHEDFPILKQMYDEGDAAVLANIGPLVEPLDDKYDYMTRRKMVPFSLFAHNAQ